MARAIIRTGGSVPLFHIRRRALRPEDHLRWAVATLRAIHARRQGETTAANDLGEALAAMPGEGAEAGDMLGGLGRSDLLASAPAYAALARLRRSAGAERPSWLRYPLRAGNAALAAVEEARCRTMARTPAVCEPPGDRGS